jgi:hypothetical protein
MGAGASKKYAVDAVEATPPTTPQTPNQKKPVVSYVRGCWLGNAHYPLIPEINGKCPFLQLRIVRKPPEKIDKNGPPPIPESEEDCSIQAWIEGEHSDTASIGIFQLKKSELFEVPSTVVPEPSEEDSQIDNVTRRRFEFQPFSGDASVLYILFVRNSDPLEGQYTLAIRNYSVNYLAKCLVPRQFKMEWWKPDDLTIPTTVIGSWEGFRCYGGGPKTLDNLEWLENNPSYSVTVRTVSFTFDEN